MKPKERQQAILAWFEQAYPQAQTELHYANPYQLLVAVILSAQCTDVRVNQVTPALFERYPTVQHLAQATAEELFAYIRSISYPNNKTKHLMGMAQLLVQRHDGQVPSTMEELTALPGVGRKTANVILSVAFDEAALAVDTHVQRVSNRLGLAKSTTPLRTEMQLRKIIPDDKLSVAHHWLILHGRYVCKARNPQCAACGLTALCQHYASLSKRKTTKPKTNTQLKLLP